MPLNCQMCDKASTGYVTLAGNQIPVCDDHKNLQEKLNDIFDMEPLEDGTSLCRECGQKITGNLHLCFGGEIRNKK